jgi:hypothetical protein
MKSDKTMEAKPLENAQRGNEKKAIKNEMANLSKFAFRIKMFISHIFSNGKIEVFLSDNKIASSLSLNVADLKIILPQNIMPTNCQFEEIIAIVDPILMRLNYHGRIITCHYNNHILEKETKSFINEISTDTLIHDLGSLFDLSNEIYDFQSDA